MLYLKIFSILFNSIHSADAVSKTALMVCYNILEGSEKKLIFSIWSILFMKMETYSLFSL